MLLKLEFITIKQQNFFSNYSSDTALHSNSSVKKQDTFFSTILDNC